MPSCRTLSLRRCRSTTTKGTWIMIKWHVAIGTFRKTRTYHAHDLTLEGLNFCLPNLIYLQETVYWYPGTKNRHMYMVGWGHCVPPKTDRFVSSSLGSFAYVPGKDGWLLLMIFSLTKNIIHRTQISGSAERHWWWIELPHRRKKSRSAWERILSFVNAPIFRQRFSAVLQPWWKALLKQY